MITVAYAFLQLFELDNPFQISIGLNFVLEVESCSYYNIG